MKQKIAIIKYPKFAFFDIRFISWSGKGRIFCVTSIKLPSIASIIKNA